MTYCNPTNPWWALPGSGVYHALNYGRAARTLRGRRRARRENMNEMRRRKWEAGPHGGYTIGQRVRCYSNAGTWVVIHAPALPAAMVVARKDAPGLLCVRDRRTFAPVHPHPFSEQSARAIAKLEQMSRGAALSLLRHSGIIDASGELTPPYRSREEA